MNKKMQEKENKEFDVQANTKPNGKKPKWKKNRDKSQFRKGKTFNDISYYTKNPSITEAFAKLPFNWIVGNIIPGMTGTVAFPAIVSYMVDWVPSNNPNNEESNFEYLSQGPDILDQVASIIYMQMRRANAGATNDIEYVDVLLSNLIASIDIFVNAHYLNRMFRLAVSYSWKNRAIPQAIFEDHFDIDYNDFIANFANYRGRFDMLVAKAKTIRTLSGFPFVHAAMAQFDEIFKDSDTDTGRESLIVSNKPFHHIYDPIGIPSKPGGSVRLMRYGDIDANASATGKVRALYTGVKPSAFTNVARMKFSALLNIMDAQINALVNDKDFNLIQADIEKAFGDMSGYIEVDKAPYDEPLKPVYSNEFNMMFRNGKFLPASISDWNYAYAETGPENIMWKTLNENAVVNSVLQDHDDDAGKVKLVWYNHQVQPATLANSINLNFNVVDSGSDNPTTDDVVVMTRFRRNHKVAAASGNPGWGIPTELVPTTTNTQRLLQANSCSNFITWGGLITVISTSANNAIKEYKDWNNCSMVIPTGLLALENHPMFTDISGIMYANISNIRGIVSNELDPIQRSCFLSLWDLPSRTNI